MRVVVTGGAGFIGAHTCRALVEARDVTEVVAFDDFSTGLPSNLESLKVSVVEGSIVDEAAISNAMQDANAVVHLAAVPSVPRSIKMPRASHDANATGTLNVLEAARHVGAQVITASSSSVYGANQTLPKTEHLASRPMSPYAASKLAAEAYTLAWGHSYGLKTLAFRFFNVYGPLQRANHAYAAVIPIFIDSIVNNRPVLIDGDGLQSRDFTYVGTVARVLADAVVRQMSVEDPLNLALGTRTTLLELLGLLEEVAEQKFQYMHREPRVGDVRHSQADSSALLSNFPDVTPVPLMDGLRATYRWAVDSAAPPR